MAYNTRFNQYNNPTPVGANTTAAGGPQFGQNASSIATPGTTISQQVTTPLNAVYRGLLPPAGGAGAPRGGGGFGTIGTVVVGVVIVLIALKLAR